MRLRKGVKENLEGKEKQRIQLHLHQRLLNNVTAHVSHIDILHPEGGVQNAHLTSLHRIHQ